MQDHKARDAVRRVVWASVRVVTVVLFALAFAEVAQALYERHDPGPSKFVGDYFTAGVMFSFDLVLLYVASLVVLSLLIAFVPKRDKLVCAVCVALLGIYCVVLNFTLFGNDVLRGVYVDVF